MTEKEEAAKLAMFFLDKLIQIADKYEVDRELFVKRAVMALIPTVDTINFKTYESEKGE